MIPLPPRAEADVRVRLALHADGAVVHAREEGQGPCDAIRRDLPKRSSEERGQSVQASDIMHGGSEVGAAFWVDLFGDMRAEATKRTCWATGCNIG